MNLQDRLRLLRDTLPANGAVTFTRADLSELLGEVEPSAETVSALTPGDLMVQEAGQQLGRSASTLRTWCAAGLIPGAYRLRGREWRIPPAALRAMLDKQAEARTDIAPARRKGKAKLGDWRKHMDPAA